MSGEKFPFWLHNGGQLKPFSLAPCKFYFLGKINITSSTLGLQSQGISLFHLILYLMTHPTVHFWKAYTTETMHPISTRSLQSVGPFNKNLLQPDWTHLRGEGGPGKLCVPRECMPAVHHLHSISHTKNRISSACSSFAKVLSYFSSASVDQ